MYFTDRDNKKVSLKYFILIDVSRDKRKIINIIISLKKIGACIIYAIKRFRNHSYILFSLFHDNS